MLIKKSYKAKVALALCVMSVFAATAQAQKPQTGKRDSNSRVLEEVIISATRADNKTPLTTSTFHREQLNEAKTTESVPYLLNLSPSVEAVGENGMVGNTSMRIRGIDATRINVNINGITLNDPESQAVFWVNIPNLAGMSQSLQIQRGLGASNGGGNSFGGALNLQTLNARSMPYGEADFSVGSWNTRQYGITAGTGIGKKGFAFDAAYHGMTTNGYIRGSEGDQQSLFMSAGHYGDRSILKAVVILGKQKTGICWYGVDSTTAMGDPTYNDAGAFYDDNNNVHYYDNETDNYDQQHYQLYYSYLPNARWTLNAALDYTHGKGYYEQYKSSKRPSAYGMDGVLDSSKTDFIIRKYMRNDAYTESFSARYRHNNFSVTLGEMFLYFNGDHYGNVLWNKQTGEMEDPFEWYSNVGKKKDATAYAKLNYDFSERSNIYADLQFRYVDYSIDGTDDDYPSLNYNEKFPFFNPKMGWNYLVDENQRLYMVAGINHREPTRADIKDAVNNNRDIKAETLFDAEMGYALQKHDFSFRANAYAMYYRDQLTPSGRISNSGYTLMENVDKSYRLGIELEGGYRFARWFDLSGNLTLSTNRIIDYIYNFNDGYVDTSFALGNTHLALSPSVIGAAVATFRPSDHWKMQLVGKYVGKEYCDNTDREALLQQDYFLLNFRTAYTWKMESGNEFELQGVVNNILNKRYMLHGAAGDWMNVDGTFGYWHSFFAQPGTNFTLRAILRF
ncbi:MAG: TonB-dependent receptor [Bacteroidales bacterium]|nr:TonB-dependent receptor [Bacteroidales bacterium]